jgi:LacI family transcriptional regulator, galactose operon repressor
LTDISGQSELGYLDPAAVFASLNAHLAETDELRARTEAMAKQPAHGRTGDRYLVGLVTETFEISDFVHPFYKQVFLGIRNRLTTAGCDLLICATPFVHPEDAVRSAAFERVFKYGVDALIVWGVGYEDPEIAPILDSMIPAMFVDFDVIGEHAGYVMTANLDAMAQIIHHLYGVGRRRIAHIAGTVNTRSGTDRLLGYRSEIEACGLTVRPEYVERGDYSPLSGHEAAKRLLELPEPPDAIAAASDSMAIGAMVAIMEAGLRVPDDIAVTGFDDLDLAAQIRPRLTTARQDTVGLGTAAAEGVLRMLENPKAEPPVFAFPAELVIRESSGGGSR